MVMREILVSYRWSLSPAHGASSAPHTRCGGTEEAPLAHRGHRGDVEVVAEDVVRVVAELQVAQAAEGVGREGVVQALDATIGLEAEVEAVHVLAQVFPDRVDALAAGAHRG